MVRIPEGCFLMGSDANQPPDNERPVHRVWVDAFDLAACQVTNAEYGKFLAATTRAIASRCTGTIPFSRIPNSRSLRHRGSTPWPIANG